MWRALAEGDRSFVEFALADDPLVLHGFKVGDYQGGAPRDPVFALVRSRTKLFVEAGDCVIVPLAGGRYRLSVTIDDDADRVAECDDLAQAWSSLRLFSDPNGDCPHLGHP